MTIRVWAPSPSRVEVEVGPADGTRRREPMSPDAGGWWRWTGDDAAYPRGAVLDYAFVLDGVEPALPDPRSAWQPHGVDGPSRTYDPAAFAWSDEDWRGAQDGAGALGGVIYELHIGTFTQEGTFDAAVGRLDHLRDLGVDVVEVLPVADFPGRWGWGYDGVDLYAVQEGYGGPEAFQRFVDACHGRGMGVCLDVVYNHLGPSGNYLARFGPYFTDTHETPWGAAVNLDAESNHEVRRFVIDNAIRWLRDFHVDALRLDAVHELKDDGPRHVLAELSDEVAALAERLGRPLDLIAESDLNDTTMVAPTGAGGLGMTAQWDDDVHHALHVCLTGETQGYYEDFAGGGDAVPGAGRLGVLAKVLEEGFLHDGRWSSFRGQVWGARADRAGLDGRRLLGYLQTHDQVGNRAVGERISALAGAGRQAAGAALYLLWSGTPMLFMGEEWAASSPWQFFTSFPDEELAAAVRDGRRAEFAGHGWAAGEVPDPQDPATRERSVLPWSEAEAPAHARMLRWYAALVRLRRAHLGGPTRLADVGVSVSEDEGWVVMRHRSLLVVANLSAETRAVPLGDLVGDGTVPDVLLAWDAEATALAGATGESGCAALPGPARRVRRGPHPPGLTGRPGGRRTPSRRVVGRPDRGSRPRAAPPEPAVGRGIR